MANDGQKVVQIFAPDEMEFREVSGRWSAQDLLKQDGIFFLKDVVSLLEIDTVQVKKHTTQLREKGRDPFAIMGVRKVWSNWMVRMKVFAPYYRQHMISAVRKVGRDWDANTLIHQKGWFYLTAVCPLLPFSVHQIRYQAKKAAKSREEIGVWKHAELKNFLVDMEIFGPWVMRLWLGLPTKPRKKDKTGTRRKKGDAS